MIFASGSVNVKVMCGSGSGADAGCVTVAAVGAGMGVTDSMPAAEAILNGTSVKDERKRKVPVWDACDIHGGVFVAPSCGTSSVCFLLS